MNRNGQGAMEVVFLAHATLPVDVTLAAFEMTAPLIRGRRYRQMAAM